MTGAFFHNTILFGEGTLNALHINAGAWLDTLMVLVTSIGSEMFYLLLLPVMYWCLNTRIALRTGAVFLISVSVNDIMKSVFNNPRPDPALLDGSFRDLAERHMPRHSPGFPSGHTQGALSLWGTFAYYLRNRRIAFLAAFFIIAVPYSRIYLGVHHFGDVLGGYFFALATMAVTIPLIALADARGRDVPLAVRIAAAVALPALVAISMPGTHIVKNAGVLTGFLCGAMICEGHVDFNPSGTMSAALAKTLLGLWMVFVLRNGLKNVLPAHAVMDYARYLLIGLWCTLAAPYLFSKISSLKGRPAEPSPSGDGEEPPPLPPER